MAATISKAGRSSKSGAATQRQRSAKRANPKGGRGSGKKPKPRGPGKPFEPGNRYVWKPGESGNPQGRQGPKISDLLREAMDQKMPADAKQALADLIKADATVGQIIGFAVALKAAGGDLEAVGVIADRTEGAPEQTIHLAEVTSDDLARAREKAKAWEAEHESPSPDAHAPPASPVMSVETAPSG